MSRAGDAAARATGLAVLLLTASTACRPEADWHPPQGRGPTRVEVMRGALHELQPGQLALIPCGRRLLVEIDDRTAGQLAEARAQLGGTPFVELRVERGLRSDERRTTEDRALVALALLRAVPSDAGDPCSTDRVPARFHATGNEPFWSVLVMPDHIEWIEPDRAEPLVFPPLSPGATAGQRTWITQAQGPDGAHHLEVVIREERCIDSMSGAWNALTAEVTLDRRTFHGCAWEG